MAPISQRCLGGPVLERSTRRVADSGDERKPNTLWRGQDCHNYRPQSGLNHRGQRMLCDREPSLGRFGIKGRGRRSTPKSSPWNKSICILGDLHATNIGPQPLLCDTRQSPPQRNKLRLIPIGILARVIDMNDRTLSGSA